MNVAPGDRVDRYELEALLGEGGQGSVWRAADPLADGAPRAVKLVSTQRADATSQERARREARALAKLKHPSLCRCYALFEDVRLDVLGIVMDFVSGMSLADAVEGGRMTRPMKDAALRHVANALAYIHENGLVHRDVKPENVLLESAFWDAPDDPCNVKLVDFGIAVGGGGRRLTKTGHGIGTPPYMAPEQIEPLHWGESRTPATDVFAFGVLVWLVTSGRHPTDLDDRASFGDYAVAYRRAADSGAWPPKLPVKTEFAPILPKCLALRPGQRWKDAHALLDGLRSEKNSSTLVDASGRDGAIGPTNNHTPPPRATVEQRPVLEAPSPPKQGWAVRWRSAALAGGLALLVVIALAMFRGAAGDSEIVESTTPPQPSQPIVPAPTSSTTSSPPPVHSSYPPPEPAPTRLPPRLNPTTVTCKDRGDSICEMAPLCASGRRCDEIDHCDELLRPGRPWHLRLADVNENGKALGPARQKELTVCVNTRRDPDRVVCTRASDAGSPRAPRLPVTTEDVTSRGLYIVVRSSWGRVDESTQPAVRRGLHRGALCAAIVFDRESAAFTETITKVSFFLDEVELQPPPTWPVRCEHTPCVTRGGEPGLRCEGASECFNPCLPGMAPEHGGSFCARVCRSDAECAHGTCEHGVCNTWPSSCDNPIGCCKRGLVLYGGTHCAKPCRTDFDCPGGSCQEEASERLCIPLCPSEGCPYLWE